MTTLAEKIQQDTAALKELLTQLERQRQQIEELPELMPSWQVDPRDRPRDCDYGGSD